jgi:hypothetical protein
MIGQGVGPGRSWSHGGEANQVRFQVEIYIFYRFVNQTDVNFRWSDRRQKGQGHRWKGKSRPPLPPEVGIPRRGNQNHAHFSFSGLNQIPAENLEKL